MKARLTACLMTIVWPSAFLLLNHYGVFLLPTQVAAGMTLPSYLACVQLTSSLLGILLVLGATRSLPRLRLAVFPDLALNSQDAARLWKTAVTVLLLAPLIYLVAYGLGMARAYDTLIAELLSRGAQAVQRQTGELGRSAQQNTLLSIIPFTVLLAPLGEELIFRGGVYGSVRSLFSPTKPAALPPAYQSAPPTIPGLSRSRQTNALRTVLTKHTPELTALLVSSIAFGAMHADVEGGMGIVRLTTASVLGLACGCARYWSGTIFAPLLLHASYNLLGLATIRGWLVTPTWPTKYTIPTLLIPIAATTTLIYLLAFFVAKRASSRRSR